VVKTYEVGDYFGELCLVDSAPRAATIICTVAAEFIIMTRKHWNQFLVDSPAVQKRVDNDRAHRKGLIEFRKFEHDSGELTAHGWNEAMNELGLTAQFGNRFDLVDADQSGRVDKKEFMAWWDREGAGVYKDELAKEKEHLDLVTDRQMNDVSDIQEMLDAVDENGDGIYSRDEVEKILVRTGPVVQYFL
jgi:hypothetical protein